VTYDTVVIGMGLAGLTAALRLAQGGHRVVVLARGLGATHLGGATIDVLGYGPERVESPVASLPGFVAAHPEHPYARVPPPLVAESLEWLTAHLPAHRLVGGAGENFLLPTAVGVPKPSALVPHTIASGDLRPGGRFVFVGFRALKDFYPAYLAENLVRASRGMGIELSARSVELPLSVDGNADLSALSFARALDHPELRKELARQLEPLVEPGETVGTPALLGLADAGAVWDELQDALGRPVFEVPTLPPSVPGIRMFNAFREAIRRMGGRFIVNNTVVASESRRGRLEAVAVSAAARPVTYRARWFVLASGGFASRGLDMDWRGAVRETAFDLPVAGVPSPGQPRFLPGYFDRHPTDRVGVAVDGELRPVDSEGRPVYENLHAAGAILAGAEPWREKSGNGISVATGYRAAGAILEAG
jgi:glycerol-3-phosphate dehydrogenase subunit B